MVQAPAATRLAAKTLYLVRPTMKRPQIYFPSIPGTKSSARQLLLSRAQHIPRPHVLSVPHDVVRPPRIVEEARVDSLAQIRLIVRETQRRSLAQRHQRRIQRLHRKVDLRPACIQIPSAGSACAGCLKSPHRTAKSPRPFYPASTPSASSAIGLNVSQSASGIRVAGLPNHDSVK